MENTERNLHKRRKLISSLMTTLTAACAVFAIAILLIILSYIAVRGITSINLEFLIDTPKPVGEGGGIGNAIVGSVLMTLLARVIGLPIGIGAGVYLAEFGENWFGKTVRFCRRHFDRRSFDHRRNFYLYTDRFADGQTIGLGRRAFAGDYYDSDRCANDRRNDQTRAEFDARRRARARRTAVARNLEYRFARRFFGNCDGRDAGDCANFGRNRAASFYGI